MWVVLIFGAIRGFSLLCGVRRAIVEGFAAWSLALLLGTWRVRRAIKKIGF